MARIWLRRWWVGVWAALLPAAALAVLPLTSALDVPIETGQLHGTLTPAGARAWWGIPYAAPPVGDRRWRAPAPAPRWTGVRDAGKPGSPCPQPSTTATGASIIVGDEDCLTLNVFHPPGAIDRALPVMVWIHGGGQMYGTGATYDASRLAMTQNVMVVTLNYRLGPLGWFHHQAITGVGKTRVTGQFALLDLIAALRWVQRNIAAFGGDVDNVTIFGESAGAQNVYALLFAPAAKGLFHRAIAESGGFWNMDLAQAVNFHDEPVPGTPLSAREVVNQWLVHGGRAATPAQARRLQTTAPANRTAKWLRSLSVADVLAPYAQAAHAEYDLPSVVYDGILLPAMDHHALLQRKRYHAVPLLIGGNRDEQKAYLWSDPNFVRSEGGRLEIRDHAHYEAVNRVYSDWWQYSAVDDLLPRLSSPVYAYRFDWQDEPTTPNNLKALYGSAHGLELAFVFDDFRWAFVHDELPASETETPPASPLQGLFNAANSDSRRRTSDAMMGYWGAFAWTGAPGRGTGHNLPEWPAWADGHRKLLFTDEGIAWDSTLVDGNELQRKLWDQSELTGAEKCSIYLDNQMYPRYPLVSLAQRGCRY